MSTTENQTNTAEAAPATYDALIGWWNGACYEISERYTLNASTLEGAIEEVEAMDFGDDVDYDIRVVVEDEDGNEVHVEHFQNSVAKNEQDAMDAAWEDEGEFATNCCGLKDGQWYTWRRNGGSRGAHDRMDGSGRWIERYEHPTAVAPGEALDWLVRHADMDTDEALDEMADADGERPKADLIMDIGECLWHKDRRVGVYRVRDILYAVDGGDVDEVDPDEAIEFVSDRDEDEDAVERFERLL